MSNNWLYQKGNPNIPLSDVTEQNPITPDSSVTEIKSVASNYQKGEPFDSPKSFIVIFSGGSKTELEYFKPIRGNKYFQNIRIEIFVEDTFQKKTEELLFNPLIFDYAYNKVKDYREGMSPDSPDSYFIVTDVDHFGESIQANKSKCKQNGINLIVSNPCFEVWLYYSVHSDRFEDFLVPDKKLSEALKKYVHTSVVGGLDTRKAIFNIKQNITNAKANYFEENGLPTLFSTQMFRLAEQMLPYVSDGLEQLKNVRNLRTILSYADKLSKN